MQEVPKKFMVVQTGRGQREFDSGSEAVKHMASIQGESKLFSPDGRLIMTKGQPPSD